MTSHAARRIPAVGFVVALFLAVALAHADEPKKEAPPKGEPKADALPKGAKRRLGDPRLAFRFAPAVHVLPPDYKAFVIADGINALRRFDIATAEPLDKEPPTQNFGGSWQIAISADGKRFLPSVTGMPTVREAATGKVVNTLKLPVGFQTSSVFNSLSVSLSADGKVAAQGGQSAGGGVSQGSVVVWNVETGDVIFQGGVPLNGPAVPVVSPDGKMVAIRGAGFGGGVPAGTKPEDDPRHMVWVYETDGGKELLKARVTPGGYQGITAVTFSPDGSLLAMACGDGVIDLWDVKTGKAKSPILGRSGQGMRVAFSPDGKTIAASAQDGSIQRWAAEDGKPLGTTEPPPILLTNTTGLAFADNERVLAWGAAGMCPVIWEAPSGKVLTPMPVHTQAIMCVAFTAGGKELLTAGQDARVMRWDVATGKVIGPVSLRPSLALTGGPSRVMVRLSPDGTKAISTSTPAAVFDVATGAEEFALPRGDLTGRNTSSFPSADGTKVIVMSVPYDMTKLGKCTVWDLVTRRKLVEVEVASNTGYPPTAAISPSGNRLVTAAYQPNPPGGQQTLVVTGWDIKTGKKLGQVEDVKATGLIFAAAASDSFAVVHSGGGRLRAYDYEAGKGGDEFQANDNREVVTGPVVFSADGKQFVSAGMIEPGVYGVRIHEWPTGKVLHTFAGHRVPVSAIAFSPDGKTLATGAQDSIILLWDMSEVK